MRKFVSHEAAPYRVTCWGGGVAYEMRRGDLSVFVQGDDALAFGADLEGMERAYQNEPLEIVLAHLWSDCGYDMAAQRDDAVE